MTQPSVVRLATIDDCQDILALCHMLFEENGFASLNEHKVMMTIAQGVTLDGGMIGVIGAPGALEGVISLSFDGLWYTDDIHLSERYNFVHPDHRKSGHAKALIEFAKRSAAELGVPLIIGVISNERTEAKIRLYRRQLGEMAGAFFIHGQGGKARAAATAPEVQAAEAA